MPGISAMCWWHFSAVSERYGSIAISFAPRRLASCARLHRCRFDAIALVPQKTISFASWNCSTSVPSRAPSVAASASPPAVAQIVRSRKLAPSLLKKRLAIASPCTRPIVPA